MQQLKTVSAAQMREIDRRTNDEFGISYETLMENAGKAVCTEILKLNLKPAEELKCVVICGRGNNGGDGLVAARRLLDKKVQVRAFIIPPKENASYSGLLLANLKRAFFKHVSVKEIMSAKDITAALEDCDIVIDTILGTGSAGHPHGITAEVIDAINSCGRPVAAIDIPSGLNPDTGEASPSCIKARWTLTIGVAKTGLTQKQAQPFTGEIKVLDIGFPKELTGL